MPDPGRSRHEDYLMDLPKERPAYPPLPWVCPNSTMINVYFEVLKAPLLDRPGGHHRLAHRWARIYYPLREARRATALVIISR